MESRDKKQAVDRKAMGFPAVGLPAGPVRREKYTSMLAASSADSADMAGGRGE